jgi:hypothetical protein
MNCYSLVIPCYKRTLSFPSQYQEPGKTDITITLPFTMQPATGLTLCSHSGAAFTGTSSFTG